MEVWKNSVRSLSVKNRQSYECLSTFMYVQIRGGNIQQMGSWHFRPFAIFGPNFLFPAAKDCTLKTAACSNFEFSFPRYGKWLIPQLSLLHEISQTWACNEFLAYSTIGKALSFSQRKWRCGKTRSGSFQWRTVSHMSVCPLLCMSKFVEATSSRWDRGTLDHLPFLGWTSSFLLKTVRWRRLHVQILNSHFPVTASGSFHSCGCSMKFLRHGPATIF